MSVPTLVATSAATVKPALVATLKPAVAAATSVVTSASPAAASVPPRPSLSRFGRAPGRRQALTRSPKTNLPRPPTDIILRDIARCRLSDHYHTSLADNLMYMHYHHELGPRPPPREIRRRYDESNPYTKFRDNPPVGGPRLAVPPPVSSPSNVIQLERIQLHCMMKSAVANKSNLLPIIMAFRALSGETLKGGGRHTSKGVELVHGRTNVGSWIRPNIPVGAKVDIRGQPMWDLTAALVEFVLPRLRGFNGFKLPKAGARWDTPSAVSGVVSIGLPTEAMGLFPQIEVNVEEYPNLSGMHIHFITNATGRGAQDRARSLVSGLGLPFIRSDTEY